ncbi:hypothetical protein BdWA1_001022 [Babesia duncani]|uniref:Uncharacterized protein n=1 Tax=Babesia duncani TaxID=323732 RepID=A0AAD9PP72_9APIC|nr:hypothetical protein BdWA1_001022 [Babesia duncani]
MYFNAMCPPRALLINFLCTLGILTLVLAHGSLATQIANSSQNSKILKGYKAINTATNTVYQSLDQNPIETQSNTLTDIYHLALLETLTDSFHNWYL